MNAPVRVSHVCLLRAARAAHPAAPGDLYVADWRADHTPGCHVARVHDGATVVLADAPSRAECLACLTAATTEP